jgi:hypothetical protein
VTADVELYVREGSRFVRADLVGLRRPVPPIPTPVRVPDVADVADVAEVDVEVEVEVEVDIDERLNFTHVPAPRCPHGSFARWATRNCKPCAREEARRGR